MWPYLTCLRHSEARAVLARLISGERLSSSCLLAVCHHFLGQMRCLINSRAGWECVLHVEGGCKICVPAGPLGSRHQQLHAVTMSPALRLRFHKQLSMLTALSAKRGRLALPPPLSFLILIPVLQSSVLLYSGRI